MDCKVEVTLWKINILQNIKTRFNSVQNSLQSVQTKGTNILNQWEYIIYFVRIISAELI